MHPLAARQAARQAVVQDEFEDAGRDAGRDAGAAPRGDPAEERAATLARLRGVVRAIEGGGSGRRAIPFGVTEIDAALGGEGLPLACLHAVEGTAADGFVAAVAGRLIGLVAGEDRGGTAPAISGAGVLVWCVPAGAGARLYPAGLLGLGLDPGRLIVVLCHRRAEMLAVMEDALRSGTPALVIAELAGDPDALTSRRLQLACEAGGVTGVLLLAEERGGGRIAASVAAFHSRWRIDPRPTERATGREGTPKETTIATRWRLSLVRNRGGTTGCWDVDWDDETHRLALVAQIGNGASGNR
jgi:protein ImuA